MRRARRLHLPLTLALASALWMGACGGGDDGGGGAPVLDPLSDQAALVDSEFTLEISATDPDGDPIKFGFASEIAGIGTRADLRSAGNKAVFRWTPIAADIGLQAFDFTASDGKNTARETITIDVRPPAGSNNAPVFRKPLGTGTTLDLAQNQCLDVEIVVEDADSPGVTITQDDPVIAGATLDQDSGLTGSWSWCPSKDQIAENDRYVLKMSADDGDNPKTTKNYLVVLRRTFKPGCPGEAPVVDHTPSGDVSTVVGLTIDAQVTDDMGIKYEPLLYFSTEPPADPPDLAQMTQVTMELIDGDMKSGTWAADVPNPVASQPAGSTATVYYLIVAQDNDDKAGDCDHLTQAPATGTFSMKVTNPGGSGGLGLCKACTTDNQCGGPNDLCMIMGTAGNSYCFRACTGPQDCPEEGYYCSATEFTSVEGKKGRQCIPETYRCTGGGSTTCVDDSWEENDTRQVALGIFPGLPPGETSGLVSCPASTSGADEDWYPIDLFDGDGTITASLDGTNVTDLDLALVNSQGAVVAKSDGLTSSEILEACVPKGTYFLRVYSWQTGENHYSLSYTFDMMSCTTSTCDDDANEQDDNAAQARVVDLNVPPYKSDTNAICAGDEDWYSVMMFQGEKLRATLAFDQANAKEDLDLILYKGTTNLTPCNETQVSGCDANNGQSGTSNEKLDWTITATDTYYVVVRGYDGSANLYDICIGFDAIDCPNP